MKRTFKQPKKISSFLTFLLLLGLSVSGFSQHGNVEVQRNNILKLNLISLPPLFNNLNQQWLGIEYQRIISKKISVALMSNFGLFEKYTFTKYYNFFDEKEGFYHISEDVRIPGYHIIPTVNYYFLSHVDKPGQGIFISGKIDYYHYFIKKEIFNSLTNKTDKLQNSTYRFSIGLGIGVQYIAFNRFSLDLNISVFTKIISQSSEENMPELYPENSFWRSANNSTWSTINLMLGYKFGSKKEK